MRRMTVIASGLSALLALATPAAAATPITLASARVALDGTSNFHEFTAATTDVRLTAVAVDGMAPGDPIERALQPGALKVFEVVVAAATLKSPKDGIDKNMHKALRVQMYPEIRFRLQSLTAVGDSAYQALGTLTIDSVDKEVALDLRVQRKGTAQLAVTGTTDIVMTDFGVAPPKAMMGMLKTNPLVHITLELVLDSSPVS